jgi:acetyl esterase/lipase
MMLKAQILAAALCAATVMPAWAFPDAPTFPDVEVAQVQYQGKPLDLKMNVYLPPGPKGAPTPIVLAIHGGGGTYQTPKTYALNLVDHGIAVATIDFRKNGMPGMLYDCKAYIRFIRAHAAEYNIDPKRLGIWGGSRGGNLAAMLAVTGDNKELEGDIGGNLNQSSMIQANVIYYPLTDMFLNTDAKVLEMIPLYLEDVDRATAYKVLAAYKKHDTKSPYWKHVARMEKFNPLNYITRNSPPAYIAAGGDDMGNPLINSTALYEKYIEQGAQAALYSYSLGTHGYVGKHIDEETVTWLVDQLSKNPPPEFATAPRPQPGPEECEKTGNSPWCTPDPILANRKP